MANILIGADICPIEGNLPFFKEGDAKRLFHDLLTEFEQADLSIANLECPLIQQTSPIHKTGPVFGVESACINGIKNAGLDILNLANNHVMDHGPAGLKNTLDVCARAGIATVGAGKNLAEARRILIKNVGNVRVGILAVAEHEFSIATKDSWGANPLDLIDCVRNMRSRQVDYDYLIVLLHGGDEFHVPSPRIKDTCRFLVEMGANAVIVQHPHVLGGYEPYLHGHIVYGQGALIMDEAIYRNLKSFHEGFLAKLSIADNASASIDIVPFLQSDPLPGARRMDPDTERRFRQNLAEKSAALQDDAFLEEAWLQFCLKRKHPYLSGLLGHNRILRKLNARGHLTKFLYGKQRLLSVRNIVSCETHREVIQTLFNRGAVP